MKQQEEPKDASKEDTPAPNEAPAEPTEEVAEASESEEFLDFQCSQCDSSFKAEEDLNVGSTSEIKMVNQKD